MKYNNFIKPKINKSKINKSKPVKYIINKQLKHVFMILT